MKNLLFIISFLPLLTYGQEFFTSNCNNGYFEFYCSDPNCGLDLYDPGAFIEQMSDSTNLIIWASLTDASVSGSQSSLTSIPNFNVINDPGYAYNTFSSFVLNNDDVFIASKDNIHRMSPTQNQFNINFFESSVSVDLTWENIHQFSSNNCGQGPNPNTNFCEGLNGDMYFAYCNNGMTNVLKISNNNVIEVIADSLQGDGIKSLAFYDNILYIANYDYVYKYENKLITDLNFKTATFQSEILTLELSNDGIPYVASSDTNYYCQIFKYLNNSWHQIENNFNFFGTSYSRDFLDFDSNNNGYLLARNVGAEGLSLYKIVNDSVNLLNNFELVYNMYDDYYAMELDNNDNPYVAFITPNNELGLIKYDGFDWLTILNQNTINPDGPYDYMDLQFNSHNDLYLMYEGNSQNASVITFCDCILQPYNTSTLINEKNIDKKLLKVLDLFGRENKQTNQPLLYIYDDSTVEKKIIIE